MGLVNYSDSDSSEDLQEERVKKPIKAPKSSRTPFQKVVDRSDTGKIKIPLPQSAMEENEHDEPPTKKIKTGNDTQTLGGFNSLLPPPKRSASTLSISDSNTATKRRAFNLKTGSAPGFCREPISDGEESVRKDPASITTNEEPVLSQTPETNVGAQVKLIGKPTMFKPLSVSRKPIKKKAPLESVPLPVTPQPTQESAPKVSLFSLSTESEKFTPTRECQSEYKSLVYDIFETTHEAIEGERVEASYEYFTPTSSISVPPPAPTPPISNSLLSLADNLHLSASERRRLFGRQNRGSSATTDMKVINFNTDQEYTHNEELRAAGEQVVHNPVRAIAPGKHSLKQLVNAAQSQKEALEESFAQGKSNRAEASSRYGW